MHPRSYLKQYCADDRLVTGAYYPVQPLCIESGDRIGIVLLNLGAPESLTDIQPFLYNLFMDPAIIELPFKGIFRHLFAYFISQRRSRKLKADYQAMGGGSPLTRFSQQQADALKKRLDQHFSTPASDIQCRVYLAMRYWQPSSEDTAKKMEKDGINKVILLPLYPQYSKTTTGASLAYWWTLEQTGEFPAWSTSIVTEYAIHPSYIQALSQRIDEGIRRFPEPIQDSIQLLFSAHGTPVTELKKRRDPYCCLIHSTVTAIMAFRHHDRQFHISFQSKIGRAQWLEPSTLNTVKKLGNNGVQGLLVVPVAFVSDHIETLVELDRQVRDEAETAGIQHYEVTEGLNSHPFFIDTLANLVYRQLQTAPFTTKTMPITNHDHRRQSSDQSRLRCHQCERITEAIDWIGTP